MSDLGGMLFDRDAVYIDLPDWKVRVWGSCLVQAVRVLWPAKTQVPAVEQGVSDSRAHERLGWHAV
jgi:hypothetical protein